MSKQTKLNFEGKMDDKIGIIKEIDRLGRIVIPKELRERFGLDKSVELVATTDGIILKSPNYKLIKIEANSVNNKSVT